MDVDEDINRKKETVGIVRKLADPDSDSDSGEEFTGYNNVSGSNDSDSESDDHAKAEAKALSKFNLVSLRLLCLTIEYKSGLTFP